jgi:PAS domain S-box-containing protein
MFRLLLIDDSPDDRSLIIRELRREFPDLQVEEVIEAQDFNCALNIGNFDIAIIDYCLRWNDGLTVVGELKSRYPNCPVIMFTNSGNEEIAVEAMKAGLDDYITKSAKHYARLPMVVQASLKRNQDKIRHKQTKAALWESQERFRLLVESVKDYAIFTLDSNGYITSWNCGAASILGYQEAKIIGQHGSCIFTPEDIKKGEDKKELQTAVAEGRAEDERWYVRANGARFWASGIVTPLRDEAGNLLGFSKIMRDMTERQQAEITLRSSEERLRLALEAAHMTIWDWNSQTNQITWSNNYELLFGFAPGSFAGTFEAVLSCIHPEDRKLVALAVTRSLKQRVDYESEFRIVCPDRSIRWLAAKGNFFYDETGKTEVRMMGVIMDITERKQATEQIKVSQQETAELKRLNQLKDDFLSTVSHELRTPMTSIKIAVSILEVVLKQAGVVNAEPNRVAQYLQVLRNECDREISLINDLLDLSSLEAGDKLLCLSALDISTWIPPIVESFAQRTRSQQQSLEIDIPTDLPTLITDQSNLERILTELLHNACKYTPTSERILVTAKADIDSVRLQVSNSGVEIPASERSRIFDKFYRIPNNDPWKHGGTGLGLALVKKLVERLEGTIQATVSFGWTSFIVELPLTPTH